MYYYGIDLHPTGFVAAQMNESGEFRTFKFGLTQKEIGAFKKMLTKEDKIALEVSGNSFWFYDQVKDSAGECRLIHPKKFASIYKSTSKTDKKDAKTIAYFLKCDLLPGVYVPEKGIRELRGLFNSYGLFQKMKVMAKNKVHALFKQNGYILYKNEINTGLLKSLNSYQLSREAKMQVELFIQEIAHLEKNQAELSTRIYGAGEGYKEQIDIIASEPGISVMTALAIISDIGGNVDRFPTAKKMASYLSSVPSVDSSNEKTRIGHTHKDGRKLSKTRMTQSIMHFRNNSAAIDNFYREKRKGKSAGTVRMAIIRKKLVGIYYMLKRGQYSRNRNEELHQRKMAEYERILEEIRMAA